MRLHRLWLENFYNLEKVDIVFDNSRSLYGANSIRFFVGLNGSGKSNALEALGLIFSHLSAGAPPGIGYDLVYQLRGQLIRITTNASKLAAPLQPIDATVFVRPSGEEGDWRPEHRREEWASSGELLPQRVVGYAAGPTSGLLWALSDSIETMVKNTIGAFEQEERPETVTQKEWQEDRRAHQEDVRRRLEAYHDNPNAHFLDAKGALCAVLPLLAHPGPSGADGAHYRERRATIVKRIGLDEEEPLAAFSLRMSGSWSARATPSTRRERLRELLQRATTRRVLDQDLRTAKEQDEPPPRDFYAVFDMDDSLRGAIEEIMGPPLAFFEELLAWQRQRALLEIRLVVRKRLVPGLLPLNALSDGEYFLLCRYALLLVMREVSDSLILLDEPETHFNDRWKIDLVKDVCDLMEPGAAESPAASHEILIATHSELMLTDADPSQVYLFKKSPVLGPGGRLVPRIRVGPPAISPFAAGRGEIAQGLFDLPSNIGVYASERVERALREGSKEDIKKLIATAGPGFHRFRLINRLAELEGRDTAEGGGADSD